MAAEPDSGESGDNGDGESMSHHDRRQRDISETLSALEDDVANEQVDLLVGLLRTMNTEIRYLEARNRQLESRLEKLEAVNGMTGGELDLDDVENPDWRDEAVIRAIVDSDDELYSARELQRLYKKHTDVRSKRTLKDRIGHITSSGLFKYEGRSTWRFVAFDRYA